MRKKKEKKKIWVLWFLGMNSASDGDCFPLWMNAHLLQLVNK